jgi:protocatechuate 3,4-dioxygenase beta subunit
MDGAAPAEETKMNDRDCFPSRRRILTAGAFTGLALAVNDAFGQQGLAPTPSCHDGDEPTIPETEGPFFTPRSPLRSDLREPGIKGRPVELSGLVLTRSCRPVVGALVDLWQADDSGEYDNQGFRLRGHVFTDAEGRYAFRTIMPGLYPGRTRHYHVKVQAPARPVLTTQFYFPDEPLNRRDDFFHRELVMQVAAAEDALRARFDVVLALR